MTSIGKSHFYYEKETGVFLLEHHEDDLGLLCVVVIYRVATWYVLSLF